MICVQDIAYARIASPDLDLMEKFLIDFGMQRASRTDRALYMSGCGTDPVVHVVEKGEARQIGFALKAASHAELDALASKFNTRVETRSEPGGGYAVRFNDPDGNLIEVLHGVASRETETPPPPARNNPHRDRARFNDTVRLPEAPAHVVRLGHVALHARAFQPMYDFYSEHFGFKPSDTYYVGQAANVMGVFLHCGLGEHYTDHHTVAVMGTGRHGFDHLGFEVIDIDDLMRGNRYLLHRNWDHSWGIGRHVAGSQIFDYWRDPSGLKVEHWTDGDLVNDQYQGENVEFKIDQLEPVLSQWGAPFNPDFLR